MATSTRQITGPDGTKLSGIPIGVTESTERFSELTLDDGSVLKTKVVTFEAVRLEDRDGEGNPMYVLKNQVVFTVVDSPLRIDPAETG